MPFKTPLNSALTESQNKALSKLNSLNTYVTAPKKAFQNLKKSQQISTFDLSGKFLDAIAGPGVQDAVLQQFTRKVFATYGEDQFLLEDIIIKALSEALDAREIYLAPQLPSGTTIESLTGSTSATTNVVEYGYVGFEREEDIKTKESKTVQYEYIIEEIEDPTIIEVRNGVPLGKRFIFNNNIGLPSLEYRRPTIATNEQIIAKSKEQTEGEGFTYRGAGVTPANGLFYPPAGTVVEVETITPKGKFVDVTSNILDKLPKFTVGTYSGETGMTIDEIVKEVKLEINKNGYTDSETGIQYPPTGTLQNEVSDITNDISGEVYNGDDGSSIPGALVEILGAKPPLGVLTDADGKYLIKGLKAGKYVFKASVANYESLTIEASISDRQDVENIREFPLNKTGNTSVIATGSTTLSTTGSTTGSTTESGLNYNTAQTSSQTTNSTGGTTNAININYSYETISEPIIYEFNAQNLPPNAPNDNYDSILLVVTNNKGIPPATITIGPIEEGGIFKNYIDLNNEKNRWIESFNDPNPIYWDNQEYPGKNEFSYAFSVANNANLPTYELTLDGALAEETLIYSLGTERVVSGVTYPPEGAQFFTGSSVVESSTFILTGDTASSGTTGGTVVTDAFNKFVGSVEANITIDQDVLNAGLSGITGDLKNELASAFSFKINPDDVGLSNREYLDKYLKPLLSAGKRALVGQIIKMVFGPKEIMSPDPEVQDKLLNSAACGEKMYSLTNNPSVTEKELEFNRVKLKKQLEKGKIELTVSCQKVEIQLPENFEEEFDLQPSIDSGVPESQRPNPAESFTLVGNYVKSEMQRQRNEEDATQVRESFIKIMIDKILQYISVAFAYSPEIDGVFNVINAELAKTGQESISPKELLSSPCEITSACKSENKKDFEEKSSFSKSIINSLYSLVLSMLIKRLISEANSKIRKLIQEKAKEKVLKLVKKQKERFKFLSKLDGAVDKAQEYKDQIKGAGLKDIFSFIKKEKAEGGESDDSGGLE